MTMRAALFSTIRRTCSDASHLRQINLRLTGEELIQEHKPEAIWRRYGVLESFTISVFPTTAADTFAAEGFQSAVAPEPSTFALIAGGFILCGALRKRVSRRAKPRVHG